jgi:CheY-like chemotaxis protein
LEEAKHSVSILLAEDNPINQKLGKVLLTKAGYNVDIANNGREAVALFMLDQKKYDLIFMDINMPELDGLEAAKEIRKNGFKRVPIIALTAAAMKEDKEKCLQAGMNDYITKPIKREIVFKTLKKWIFDRVN